MSGAELSCEKDCQPAEIRAVRERHVAEPDVVDPPARERDPGVADVAEREQDGTPAVGRHVVVGRRPDRQLPSTRSTGHPGQVPPCRRSDGRVGGRRREVAGEAAPALAAVGRDLHEAEVPPGRKVEAGRERQPAHAEAPARAGRCRGRARRRSPSAGRRCRRGRSGSDRPAIRRDAAGRRASRRTRSSGSASSAGTCCPFRRRT